jgi:hypothetical protein
MKNISIAKDFSRFPAGRFEDDGPHSGERFRAKLVPLLKEGQQIKIDLDGTLGYGSSFLEEAFGGLVRVHNFTAETLRKQLSFKSSDSTVPAEIWSYIDDAARLKEAKTGPDR